MLNSFWGKFGQRENMTQSLHTCEPEEYFKLILSDGVLVEDIQLINEKIARVQYKYREEFVKPLKNVNVIIAAYTTTHARMKLYDLLDSLGERNFYHDTDSVIFLSTPGTKDPPLSDFLGGLTSELKPGVHITEFLSTGPKCYTYKHSDPEIPIVSKIKGIRLNYKTGDVLNMESMLRIYEQTMRNCENDRFNNNDPYTDTITPNLKVNGGMNIMRNKNEAYLFNTEMMKTFQCVFTKRIVFSDGTTLPFGY